MPKFVLSLIILLALGCHPARPPSSPLAPSPPHWVECHEAGHAIYAYSAGYTVTAIEVVRKRTSLSGSRFAGLTHIDTDFSENLTSDIAWQACAVYMAGAAAESVCERQPTHDSARRDRQYARQAIAWLRNHGTFPPPWESSFLPVNPSVNDLLAECRWHAFIVLMDRRQQLYDLDALLREDVDGRVTRKQLDAFFKVNP